MGRETPVWTLHQANTNRLRFFSRDWFGHVGAGIDVATILLSVGLGVRSDASGADQLLVGTATFSGEFGRWGLEAGHLPLAGGVDLRFFLGNVELFLLPEMDLPYAGSAIRSHF